LTTLLDPEVEILLPVHNEADGIERVTREIYNEISPKMAMQFIVCEDGSSDDSKNVLTRLENKLPMKLIIGAERKGYSRAVREGMQALSAPYLLCLDSDGQCDPADFWNFWKNRESHDVILGWRTHRIDVAWRRFFSRTFYFLWQFFYNVPVHDPSCPYMLARKGVIDEVCPQMGEMDEGFWWEFVARVHRLGFSILEVPIRHRERTTGSTRVYTLLKLPLIGYRHVLALFKIWSQTRSN
jgi:dolichol-phosphate mannosyltransferase